MKEFNSALLNNGSILKKIVIKLNDNIIPIEDVVSTEIKWSGTFIIDGNIHIKDTVDWSAMGVFNGETILDIYSIDIFDETFHRKFIITNVHQEEYNDRFKFFVLDFTDEISYKLRNTYLSKGYEDSKLSECVTDFFDYLEIQDILTPCNLELDFDDTTEGLNFVVPQDRSFYDFICKELELQGYRWYQTRKRLHIKPKDSLLPNQLDTIEHKATNKTSNNMYAFKIHDITIEYNNVLKLNKDRPNSTNFYFDFEKKTMEKHEQNLEEVKDDITLMDSDYNLVHTVGSKYVTQHRLDDNVMINSARETYLNNNIINIVIVGDYKYSNVNQLIDFSLKGNIMSIKGQVEGDIPSQGLYVVSAISDRIMGDKIIQRYTLNRLDFKVQ